MDLLAQDIMIFSQSLNSNIKGFNVEDFIVLSDFTDQNYLVQGLQSVLDLSHLAELSKDKLLSASNNLSLSQSTHSRVFVLSVESRLNFVSDYDLRFGNRQVITISENATENKSKGSYSTLLLTQLLELKVTKNLTVSELFIINSNVTGYLPSKYWTSFSIPPF